MRRLRVVSVCRALPNPVSPSEGLFVAQRLSAMAEIADVTVVQPVPYLPVLRPLPAWAAQPTRRLDGLNILHAPMFYTPGMLKSMDGLWLSRAIGPVVERVHREGQIDLIDAHFGYPDGAGCMLVGQRLNIPVFITVRGFEAEFINRPRVGQQLKEALRNARGLICVSRSLVPVATGCGVPEERIKVVHNAIDTTKFGVADRRTAREALGVSPDVPLILAVGHSVPRKRHHVTIEAFARLRPKFPSSQLVIIGSHTADPGYHESLQTLVNRLQLGDSVRFIGDSPSSAVRQWLTAATIFALATAREGCCNAVLEALASGLPCVITRVGDNECFVEEGFNGFLTAVDDVEEFRQALENGLNHANWDQHAIAARLRQQVGDWSRVAREVIDFLEQRMQERGDK